jgi:Pro-kumamolisin, activation domain/Bacterial Ig-like domain (group 1)
MQRSIKALGAAFALVGATLGPVAAGANITTVTLGQLSPALTAPAGAVYLGTTSSSTPVSLRVVLQPRNVAALQRFIHDVQTPGSSLYHHYLSKGQFGSVFGPTSATQRAVTTQLESNGLHVSRPSANGMVLTVTGSASNVARAFATTLGTYRAPNGVTGFVANAPVRFPQSLVGSIAGVTGLSSFAHATSFARPAPHAALSTPTACSDAVTANTNRHEFLPASIDQLYGIDNALANGFDGSGQSVALVEFASYFPSDITTYFNCYGLTNTLTNIQLNGGAGAGTAASDGIEVELDIQQIAGVAPGSTILDYEHPNDGSAFVDTFNAIAKDDTASTVSVSWGECETQASSAGEQPILMQMAAQGQSVFVASGDSGSSSCAYNAKPGNNNVDYSNVVDDPGNSPWVTSVGGVSVSSISPLVQSVWNDMCGGGVPCGGGGGASGKYSHPSWQVGPGTDSTLGRQEPDLSVIGDPATGMLTYFNGGWHGVGGTSIGAPLMAAVTAVGAQSCGVSRLGFLNPRLYQMGAAGTGFNDVTVGTNDLYSTGSYSAGPGYDMASGLGTPDPATFLGDLCATLPSLSADSYGTGASATWTIQYTNGTQALQGGSGSVTLHGLVAGGLSSSTSSYTINGVHPSQVVASGTTATLTVANTIAGSAPITVIAHGVVNAATTGTVTARVDDSNGYVVYFPVTFVASTVAQLTATADSSAGQGLSGATMSVTVLNGNGNTLAGVPVTVSASGHGVAVPVDGGVSDLQGVAHFRIVDAYAESTTVTASVGGVRSSSSTVAFSNPFKIVTSTLNPKAGALVGQPRFASNCGVVSRTAKGSLYASVSSVEAALVTTSGAAKVPTAGSDPGVTNGTGGVCDIAYIDKTGAPELIQVTSGTATVTKLSTSLGGLAMVASPGVLVQGTSTYVTDLSKSGSLELATLNNGTWSGTNLTMSAGASKITGTGYALANSIATVGGAVNVAVRSGKTALLFWYNATFGAWQTTDLPTAAFISNTGTSAIVGNVVLTGGSALTAYLRTSGGHLEVLLPDPENAGYYLADDVTAVYPALKVLSDPVIVGGSTPKVGVLVGKGFDLLTSYGSSTQPWLPVSLTFTGVKTLFANASGGLSALAGTKVGAVTLK